MKILFDHQVFSWQRYGGISRYFANIYDTIKEQSDIDAGIGLLYSENYYIRDFKGFLSNDFGKLILSKSSRRYKWNKQYSKYLIKSSDFDIFHPTYYNPYFINKIKKPYVLTVHDMIHELMPEYFNTNDQVSYQKRLCVEKASHIIAISETTKTDLINILGISDDKITVIHHGYKYHNITTNHLSNEQNGDYLLFVGDRAGYKNFTNFLSAIAPLLLERNNLRLICAGGGSFQSMERELLLRLKLTEKVTQISASEAQLHQLYANAILFVFPSLYEGFGLPLLEAFQQDCPIIASDNACFREILGNAGNYFDPLSHSEILNKVKKLVDDTLLRNELVIHGKRRLKDFTMQECMDKTINVYRNLK